MTDRTPPHNDAAEESLLGAAMLSTVALGVLCSDVEVEDFYIPKNQMIAAVLKELWVAGIIHADPVLVADELRDRGQLEDVGGATALVRLQADTPSTTNAAKYARLVVDDATKRRLVRTGLEIADLGYNQSNAALALDAARSLIGSVDLPIGNPDPSMNVYDFMAVEDTYDWLVKDLIEKQDRLILTGGEGRGKSTFLRQMAVALAAGIHPFNFSPTIPCKVTVIDVENSRGQISRKLEPIIALVDTKLDPDNLRIEARTGGIDLTQRHDSQWLLERVAANKPDVLIIGPIYKLHAQDPVKEEPARKVIGVLDMIRSKFGCALLIEAHSPYGDSGARRPLRPFGASIWSRWPEFGFGLRDDVDGPGVWFERWRGPRDEREWPARLSRMVAGDGNPWPWRDSQYLPPGVADAPRSRTGAAPGGVSDGYGDAGPDF